MSLASLGIIVLLAAPIFAAYLWYLTPDPEEVQNSK
jgi:hypothetical protein